MKTWRKVACLVSAAGAAAGAAGCSTDPVHEAEVAALGPEQMGIPKGEYHRAGQPCLVCHGGEGPAHKVFSFAGTVFAGAFACGATNNTTGVGGAQVIIQDSHYTNMPATTNCVGNFTVPESSSFPYFPASAEVYPPDSGTAMPMLAHINRAGSCADCHADPAGPAALGHVYVNYTSMTSVICPVPVEADLPSCSDAGSQ